MLDSTRTICSLGVWDSSVPGIKFDENGVSNFAKIQQKLMEDFPRGEKGKKDWLAISEKIRQKGKGNRYDCVIGVSGGTDSSYLLHVAKEYNLNPLAVNLDNGWSSDIAVKNIKKVCQTLGIDLETYVIDYEEIKDILRSYMRSGLPWIDNPTDLAIHSVLYKTALKENVKYILIGTDFHTEGKQPSEWTYGDSKQLKYVLRNFGSARIRTFPLVSFPRMAWLNYFRGMKVILPFNYLDYRKSDAQKFLLEKYGWEYYGEHHHENLFTKWAIGYWMYEKFGIDKRIITYSAQVLSGEITREQALQRISKPPYEKDAAVRETGYVLKKLGIAEDEFRRIWSAENKGILDYPSYYHTIIRYKRILVPMIQYVFKVKPKFFYELELK